MDCLAVHDSASLTSALLALEHGGLWAVAALDYELGYLLESAAAPDGWLPPTDRPLARFWRFSDCACFTRSEADAWLAERFAAAAEGGCAGIGGLAPAVDENWHASGVDRIRHYIGAGDCYQVNLTFPLTFSWFGDPLALYMRLRERQPVRFGGLVGDSGSALVSLSPELFLERCGDRLRTRPMKGTAPRTDDPSELQNSPKDRAENVMIVDLLRNDLGRVARNGSVAVTKLFEIEDYPTLWQMVSEVTAEVPGRSLAEVLAALFPCGSITGAPKIRAMRIAAEIEGGRRRGAYTGALGWIAPNGDFRLNVAIRTLDLAAGGQGSLGVGSGVVADSTAPAEWRECLLKSRFLEECDPGLHLIETLRRENGVYPRLDLHLQRLRQSARWFGFPLDEGALRERLAGLPVTGIWSVRLTLDKRGDTAVSHFPLAEGPAGPRLARLHEQRIDSGRLLQRHKTSARHVYDRALGSLSADSAVFDFIFLNERGEVAEGARSNVFVERDGVLMTPPLTSGALPGVLRAELLGNGRARESVLFLNDLESGFWLGNALRGLIPVTLARAPAV